MSGTAPQWFKSSYSDNEGGACLEASYTWRKSSYSSEEGGQCLEVAACPHTIHIRDSKNPADDSPTLHIKPSTWTAFTKFAAR
ncbi:DUF397 domain-containing protein [Streptomyces spinoverrucosus]|uniref:DUF397 domain-containing protein n=1 Tax=Streptomyces spinoverrucosus TaxID=284043 RepID=UPI0018C3925B|nr:DUF397 domain-containing protein [Streptomyces spinoverrucosus]MBG0853370.1 DUF397 domain-containing protein [Streptomyces spinoverrucosus]